MNAGNPPSILVSTDTGKISGRIIEIFVTVNKIPIKLVGVCGLLAAVQYLHACFWAFNLKYPEQSSHVFQYIEKVKRQRIFKSIPSITQEYMYASSNKVLLPGSAEYEAEMNRQSNVPGTSTAKLGPLMVASDDSDHERSIDSYIPEADYPKQSYYAAVSQKSGKYQGKNVTEITLEPPEMPNGLKRHPKMVRLQHPPKASESSRNIRNRDNDDVTVVESQSSAPKKARQNPPMIEKWITTPEPHAWPQKQQRLDECRGVSTTYRLGNPLTECAQGQRPVKKNIGLVAESTPRNDRNFPQDEFEENGHEECPPTKAANALQRGREQEVIQSSTRRKQSSTFPKQRTTANLSEEHGVGGSSSKKKGAAQSQRRQRSPAPPNLAGEDCVGGTPSPSVQRLVAQSYRKQRSPARLKQQASQIRAGENGVGGSPPRKRDAGQTQRRQRSSAPEQQESPILAGGYTVGGSPSRKPEAAQSQRRKRSPAPPKQRATTMSAGEDGVRASAFRKRGTASSQRRQQSSASAKQRAPDGMSTEESGDDRESSGSRETDEEAVGLANKSDITLDAADFGPISDVGFYSATMRDHSPDLFGGSSPTTAKGVNGFNQENSGPDEQQKRRDKTARRPVLRENVSVQESNVDISTEME